MVDNWCFASAASIARNVRDGEARPTDVIEAYLERIEQQNDATNAYVTVTADCARDRARYIEQQLENEEDPGPLAGVPVAIKDLCPVKDVRLTFGSKPFSDHVAERSAILVKRLKDAGAIVLGKTNICEFGFKGTTDNRVFGPTSTPFNLERNAGGSSGGSAAAVADGLTSIGQGGDGGGSVRIPASLCGVYGFKPSFGRVPFAARPDAFSEHTPFIHRGPITRTVSDAALAMDIIAGPHPADPFSLPGEVDFRDALDHSIEGLDVAYSPDLGLFPVNPAVESVIESTINIFEDCGASVELADPPLDCDRQTIFEAWQTGVEVFNAGLVDGIAEKTDIDYFNKDRASASPAFVASAERGQEYGALDAKRAERVRTKVYDAFREFFQMYDLLLTPTLAVPFIENDTSATVGPNSVAGDSVDPLVGWALTYPFNMTGHPVASIPAGFIDEETPTGMQLVGPRHADSRVIAASAAFEREQPWHDAYPPRDSD